MLKQRGRYTNVYPLNKPCRRKDSNVVLMQEGGNPVTAFRRQADCRKLAVKRILLDTSKGSGYVKVDGLDSPKPINNQTTKLCDVR